MRRGCAVWLSFSASILSALARRRFFAFASALDKTGVGAAGGNGASVAADCAGGD